MCRKTLERESFVVLQAAGSSEALKLLAEHRSPVDLVVTDILLPPPDFQLSIAGNPFPRVNGQELVDLLLDSMKELRIMFMSTSSRDDLLAGGMIRPTIPFLQKPFTAEAFSNRVHEALAGPAATKQPKKPGPNSAKRVDWFG